jgi:hypothetical protein
MSTGWLPGETPSSVPRDRPDNVELASVLVGFDGSPTSEHALVYANGLAKRLNARLLVASIERQPSIGPGLASLSGYPMDPYLRFPIMLGSTLLEGDDPRRDEVERGVRNVLGSIARMTAARGVPKIAAIPAAAPLASKILRSAGVTLIPWPTKDPSAPPVTMIGPSAPNGPPVPIATAADVGLATAARGWMRLCLERIASIASGIPWPRMTGDHFASNATTSPPATAAGTSVQSGWKLRSDGRSQPHWCSSNTFVITPMRCTSTYAAPPAAMPSTAASSDTNTDRRAVGEISRCILALRAAVISQSDISS